MIYTGIGARKTPGDILHAMVQVGEYMAKAGHTLRSGGAQGADRAFEIGCDFKGIGYKEIYLPCEGWNGNTSPMYHVSQDAQDVAALFHPAWSSLKPFVRKLMGRNAYQMLGLNLVTRTDFVVCWSPHGDMVGGTGQALRMAAYYEIPVINFGNLSLAQVNDRLMDILESKA